MIKLIYIKDGVTTESVARVKYDKIARMSRDILLSLGYVVKVVRY
jgi:hypothetical protein